MAKHTYYESAHWKELRAKALRRGDYRCARCGAGCRGKRMSESRPYVDHIHPRPLVSTPTRLDIIDNLQVLCGPCHTKKTKWVDHSDKEPIGLDGFPEGSEWGG